MIKHVTIIISPVFHNRQIFDLAQYGEFWHTWNAVLSFTVFCRLLFPLGCKGYVKINCDYFKNNPRDSSSSPLFSLSSSSLLRWFLLSHMMKLLFTTSCHDVSHMWCTISETQLKGLSGQLLWAPKHPKSCTR